MQRFAKRIFRRYSTWLACLVGAFIITAVCFKGPCILMGNRKMQGPGTNKQEVNVLTHSHLSLVPKLENTHTSTSSIRSERQSTHGANRTETDMDPGGYDTSNASTVKPGASSTKSPVTRISFLKVHKAGSSTVQNILFRFGIAHNLTFALPEKGHYLFSKYHVLPVKDGGLHDIYACHTGYQPGGFNVSSQLYTHFAIVREPLDRMISAAYYYRDVLKKPYLLKVPKDHFIQNLINNPDVYETDVFSRTRNSMGSDFGFPKTVTRNNTSMIQRYMAYLKRKFRAVVIMDRFDESLVFLKRKFHWSLQDIIYVKSNTHSHPDVNLTTTEKEKFKENSYLDYVIYDTFNAIFDSEIRWMGPEFQMEVSHFRVIIKEVNEFCTTAEPGYGTEVQSSKWNPSFEVVYNDCSFMQMGELEFVSNLKKRHRTMNK